jgi:hypothetical protein
MLGFFLVIIVRIFIQAMGGYCPLNLFSALPFNACRPLEPPSTPKHKIVRATAKMPIITF